MTIFQNFFLKHCQGSTRHMTELLVQVGLPYALHEAMLVVS